MSQKNSPPGRPPPTERDVEASATGKRATFARPATPTDSFAPQSPVQQALLEESRSGAPPRLPAPTEPHDPRPPRASGAPPSVKASASKPPPMPGGGVGGPSSTFRIPTAPPIPIPGSSVTPPPVAAYTPAPPPVMPLAQPPLAPHTAMYNPRQTGSAGAIPAAIPSAMPGSLPPSLPGQGAPVSASRAAAHVLRTRAYAFALDPSGQPIEIGSGRFGKVFLGEERWLESKTDFRRTVVIKLLQKGVASDDLMRFQLEKELLERVQGHPNIVRLFASGEGEELEFLPASIRDKVESEFVILEKLDMSLEERLKGSRVRGEKDDLLACQMNERLFRVLDYMIPAASAIEFAHLVKNISHRDIKPANILIGLPDPNLRGSTLEVRLADFNVAKVNDAEMSIAMTRMNSVPGTLFFQSPEQETNVIELLVNVTQGSAEVDYFEDFYIQIAKNDTFGLFNRGEHYPILYADRAKKKIVLARPWRETSETNVRAKIQKSVGRPADIYSLGALFYYLISGAYANPKTLYDNFHKFIEYEKAEENNTIEGYLEHEYSVINSLRAPKGEGGEVAPADRFFSYKHYLDGNGELIDPHVMKIIAKCMIRNKPDSYCQAHDVETRGISTLVQDLIDLYTVFGVHPAARPQHLARLGRASGGRGAFLRSLDRFGNRLRWLWLSLTRRKR